MLSPSSPSASTSPSNATGDSVPVLSTSARFIVLPNGTKIRHLSPVGETQYIYKEIYEERTYLRHGITLQDGAVVVDAGANIGLFSLFVLQNFARVKTYAFEPIPDTHAALRHNLLSHAPKGSEVHLFQHGLAEHPGTAEFAFYPNAPGNSTTHTDEKNRIKGLFEKELLENCWRHSKLFAITLWMLFPFRRLMVKKMVNRIYKQVNVTCTLRRLSDVLEEQNVERVDLLKVDVEGAELDVLRGIRSEHWARIRQVVMEVHDVQGRLGVVRDMLKGHGFEVVTDQDDNMAKASTYNLYAVKR
jgi:phthiocerol/phenolphthiocerol synthesis type-I polyketide synthase E